MYGVRYILRSVGGRFWHAVAARLPVAMHSNLVIVEMSIPELTRAGLLHPKGRRSFLGRVYQVYWWLVVIIVLLIPTRPDQLSFYFPAVLGSRPAAAGKVTAQPSQSATSYAIGVSGVVVANAAHGTPLDAG
jgi:hypothetical protein